MRTASYQLELPLGARQLLTAGAEVERETGAIGDRSQPPLRPERTSLGVYVQDRVLLGSRAYLTAGARVERNGSYGTRAVPRAALALRLRAGEDATTLRASAGMGIKEPSFLESYGESLFARGNPDLNPERSTTFDLGIEQRLFSSRLRASVTAFHHTYRDQIAYTVLDYTTYEGSYVNLARTRSRGIEVAVEARPVKAVWIAGQYTYQDGKILESPSDFDPVYAVGEPLLRRPRHQGSLSGGVRFGRASFGATVVHVGARADSDFVGLGLKRNDAYTRLDARARARVFGPLEAFVVAENLADASYQEVLGYPALGRSFRAGLRLAVGGHRARAGCRRHSEQLEEKPAGLAATWDSPAWPSPRCRCCCSLSSVLAAAEPPERVASLNLTADELLVEMLPPERLVAVTRWADDPEMSNVAGRVPASAVRLPRADLERLIELRPDLVVVSEYTDADFLHLLARSGLRHHRMVGLASLTGIRAAILDLGRAVGTPAEAARLDGQDGPRARRSSRAPAGRAPASSPLLGRPAHGRGGDRVRLADRGGRRHERRT